MSENDKNINAAGSEQTEDSITLHTEGISKPEKKSEPAPERKIKAAPVVHTSGNSDIRIPEASSDELPSDRVISRFIKTNKTPFVSVSSDEPENDGADIDRYSDRISVKAPEKKIFAGFTAKLNVYSENHSADAEGGRMIQTAEEPAAGTAEDDSDMKTPDVKTREVSFDESGKAEINDSVDSAPTKHIADPKGSLLREIADTADDGVRRNPDQLMMEGFDSVGKRNEEEKAREEAELADELTKSRQQRISAFKFWDKKNVGASSDTADEKFSKGPEKTVLPAFLEKISASFEHLDTDFTPATSEEYADFNSRREVFAGLINARKGVLLRLLIVGLLGVILFIIDIAASVSASKNPDGFFTLFGGSYTAYTTVNLIGLAACIVLMFRDLKTGAFSLLKVHPKADTSLLLLLACTLVQNVAAYFTQLKLEENFHLLTPAAILLCVPYLLAKLFYYDNTRHCFKAAAAKSEKSYLRRVSDEALVAELLRDRESGAQNVVYAGKTRFISGFLARSANSAYAGMPSSRSVLITAGVSLIVGIIAAIVRRDAVYGITALTMSLAFSFPVSCLFATGFKISSENKKLSVKSSFVQSHNDARDFAAVDNIIIDDSDIFSAEISNCVAAKGVSEKQAKFCAAVLTAKFGGPLHTALMETVGSLEDKFPAAENLVYEEKLGLSAWVSNCKVLLGTHALLVNHNVQVPEEKAVGAFLSEDAVPLYLALEGRFAAVLGVKYSCRSGSGDNLRELVKNGASILLCTHDANLSETYAEQLLGMPECSVRTVSPAVSDKIKASMQAVTDSEDAGIVFNDSFDSFCRCAGAAIKLDRSKKTSKLVCEAGAYVGLVLAAALSFAGAFTSVSSVLPLAVQLLWLVICFAAPLLFSSSVADVKSSMPRFSISLPTKRSAPSGRGREAADIDIPEETPSEEEFENISENESAEQNNDVPADTPDTVTDNTPEKALPEENSAESVPSQTVSEPDEPAEEEDIPGVISQRTYDALDAFAGDAPVKKRSVRREVPTETENGAESRFSDDEGADEAENDTDMLAETLNRAKRFFGSLVSRFTVAGEPEETPTDESSAEDASETPQDDKDRPFTATIPVRKKRSENIETEDDVMLQAQEVARMRASFTPPEMPEAPHYELKANRKPAEKDPLKEKFVPPETQHTDYYTDAVFSRFEDDNIFAALHEDDNTSDEKYDL